MCKWSPMYRPQRNWGKVIFSVACVKNSVHSGGSTWAGTPCRYTPRQVHPQTGTPHPRQVHLTPGRYTPWQVHPPGRYTPWAGSPLGKYTHPLDRYTLQAGTSPQSSACWEIWATSRRYTSYWNAFLFSLSVWIWFRQIPFMLRSNRTSTRLQWADSFAPKSLTKMIQSSVTMSTHLQGTVSFSSFAQWI